MEILIAACGCMVYVCVYVGRNVCTYACMHVRVYVRIIACMEI